jgi:RNA polymerase sigma-70 factor (ECF subfamily)
MTTTDDLDQRLAERARAGDRDAFETLVRRTGRLVFAQLYLAAGNPHEAEDLTQETFLVACRQIHRLEDAAAFRGWILQIARTVHLDSVKKRSRKKRGKPGGAGEIENVPDGSPSPGDRMEQIEQRQAVLMALRELPEDYQRPLSLRYLAGSDYDTISRQLGLTNGSLRGLLYRGLEMLREKLK